MEISKEHKIIFSTLSSRERLTYMILEKMCSMRGERFCSPTIREISMDMGLDYEKNKDNLRKILRKLEKVGLIKRIEQKKKDGSKLYNTYMLFIDKNLPER